MAIIDMLHTWCLATDANRSTIRTIIFDYRKASDLIDHGILEQLKIILIILYFRILSVIDLLYI